MRTAVATRLALALIAFASPARRALAQAGGCAGVVVNEIRYAPPAGETEYVELTHTGARPCDLATLALADAVSDARPLPETGGTLEPGGYVAAARDSAALAAAFPGVRAIELARWPALNNDGDAVRLLAVGDTGHAVLDAVPYRPAWGGSDGRALERRDPDGPSWHASNWASAATAAGGTPGAQNSVYAVDRLPPRLRLAEEVPAHPDSLALALGFDEPLDASRARVLLDGRPAPRFTLVDESAIGVAVPRIAHEAVDEVVVERIRDLKGNELALGRARVARLPAPGDLVVNEILFDPRDDPHDGLPDQPEYVELLNAAPYPLALRGLFRTDAPDERGRADTLRWMASGASLAPDAYAVVFADPDDVEMPCRDGRLARAFPTDLCALDALLLPVSRASLQLDNDGDHVRLHRADGLVIEQVRYSPHWHVPTLASTDGVALIRLSPTAAADEALNWTSSPAPAGGSPGEPNRLIPTAAPRPEPGEIVVSEILYEPVARDDDGRPDQPEYLELHNGAAAPRALDGLRLVGAEREDGGADTLRVAYGPVELAPGGYAVVFRAPDDGAPDAELRAAFPALPPDARLLPVRRSLGLANDGDRVALVRADGTVLDDVPYRPSWHAAALRETAGRSLERLDVRGDATRASNWTSSVAPDGGTPGAPNSVALTDGAAPASPGLTIAPSPFSPDGDGIDDVAAIRYRLDAAPASIRVRIFDIAGRRVRELEPAALSAATGALAWDGRGDDGRALRIGLYVVHLESVSAERGRVETYKAVVVLARRL